MSSKANKPSGRKPSQLTEKENEFIKAMFDNMTQRPDADWDKVADDLGLSNAKCAKERFRQMSKKHGWGSGPDASPIKKSKITKPASNIRKGRRRQARSKAPYTEVLSDSAESNGELDVVKISESDDEYKPSSDLAKDKAYDASQTATAGKGNATVEELSEPLPLPDIPSDAGNLAPYEESELDEDDLTRWADEF